MKRPTTIPRLPYAFFKFYCKRNRFEELHGDLEEYFYERVETKGMVKAKWLYTRDVLRCCQPYAWKTPHIYQNSNLIMFRNYFKTATRSALRNPLGTFINLFGLSLAIGVCVMIYAFYNQSINTDRFHENKDNVFLATIYANRDGQMSQYGMSPMPLAAHIEDEMAGIKNVCRVDYLNTIIRLNDQVFYENIHLADASFLEMFTFPLKWGCQEALKDVNSIILSEEIATKYFDTENPLGKEVLIVFKTGEKKYFSVGGVAESFPDGASIQFDFLINYDNVGLAHKNHDPNDWSVFLNSTFIQLKDPSNVYGVQAGLTKYKELQNEVKEDWKISDFELISIHDLYLSSEGMSRVISYDRHKPGRVVLPVIGIFMLVLACLNYVNMAINSVAKRLKEIGVRKVMGADKRKVMFQFLAENVIVTSFALLSGLILGVYAFIPWFEGISGDAYTINITDQLFYIFLIGLMILTGVASGLYPAFYISRFEAVKIFKGKVRLGNRSWLTKSFLGLQMVLAIITITGAVLFIRNTEYQIEREWGYDQADVLYVRANSPEMYEQLMGELDQIPGIESLSGSLDHIGRVSRSTVVERQEEKYEVSQVRVSPEYLESMGLDLKSGQFLTPELQVAAKELVVNETFVERLGMTDPLGMSIKLDGEHYQIVGIVKDFHFSSFAKAINPTVFSPADKEDLRFIVAELALGQEVEIYTAVEKKWDELYPETPFDGGLQAGILDGYFALITNFARFNKAVASMAVILAMLGLYGLITLNISGRMKEFSIRKTLGAEAGHLGFLLTKEYRWLTLISVLLGAPMGFYAAKFQMNLVFAYPIPMGMEFLIIPVVILILLILLVLSSQLFKVLKFNPVKGLRSE